MCVCVKIPSAQCFLFVHSICAANCNTPAAQGMSWGAPLLDENAIRSDDDRATGPPTDGRKVRESPPGSPRAPREQLITLRDAADRWYTATTMDGGKTVINLQRIEAPDGWVNEVLDPTLLDPRAGYRDKIWITVVRYVMFVSCAVWLAGAFVAFIAYTTWGPSPWSWLICWILLGSTLSSYSTLCAMAGRKTQFKYVVLGVFIVSLIGWLSAMAVVLVDEAVIQLTIIQFLSTMALGLYTIHRPRALDRRLVLAILFIGVVVGWCAGIAAYYGEHDWITAFIVLGIACALAMYHWFFAEHVRVTNYPEDEAPTALIHLFTLPITSWLVGCIRAIRNRKSRKAAALEEPYSSMVDLVLDSDSEEPFGPMNSSAESPLDQRDSWESMDREAEMVVNSNNGSSGGALKPHHQP